MRVIWKLERYFWTEDKKIIIYVIFIFSHSPDYNLLFSVHQKIKIIGERAAIRYFHSFPPTKSFLKPPTMGFQTLKLAAFPASSTSRLIFRPPTKTPSLSSLHPSFRCHRPPSPLLVRAFSLPAVQVDPPTVIAGEEKGNFIFSSLLLSLTFLWFLQFASFDVVYCYSWIGLVVRPQWKASIDFKWIRDNKDLVASNIENRKSGANLDLVLQLYDKMLSLQKVRFWFGFFPPFIFWVLTQLSYGLTL